MEKIFKCNRKKQKRLVKINAEKVIIGGELVYIGTDEKEKQWITEMGITTQ